MRVFLAVLLLLGASSSIMHAEASDDQPKPKRKCAHPEVVSARSTTQATSQLTTQHTRTLNYTLYMWAVDNNAPHSEVLRCCLAAV
jgi:hypothetical protein